MLARLAFGIGKFAVKNILVPIAITAATAVVLQKLADRVDPDGANGRVTGRRAKVSSSASPSA